MKINQHTFAGQTDLRAMEALAREFRTDNLHVSDLPWRLSSWALDDPQNVSLWRDETGKLLGWAVLQSPWWTIDYAFHPRVERELFPQVLAWADQRALSARNTPHGVPSWFAMAFAEQTERQHDLEAAGFACQANVGEDSWSKVALERPGDLPVKDYRIPEGFTVRPLNGLDEAEAYVDLQREVFESKNMTVDWRKRSILHPDHVADVDLVVQAPDGRLAAFCVCWLDAENQIGQIEPLGCRAEFRRYALGRVALADGLRRLQAHGAKKVFVETDNWRSTAEDLYESMGFVLERDVLVYRKDY